MNIQQILSEGQGLVLNSVIVEKDYGQKAGQTPHRALLIKDNTGKTILKLWGASSNQPIPIGQTITVQGVDQSGSITASEFRGKWSLNANSCEIILGETAFSSSEAPGVSAAPPQVSSPPTGHPASQNVSQAPPQASPAQGSPTALTPDQLADTQAAHFARILSRIRGVVEESGADPSSAVVAAAQMTGSAPDYWFGAKWPGMPGLKAKCD